MPPLCYEDSDILAGLLFLTGKDTFSSDFRATISFSSLPLTIALTKRCDAEGGRKDKQNEKYE